jgi:prevent-host-death family protein
MNTIPKIRPISDLRNHFTEIASMVCETAEPVYLTKNGRSEMVVMSIAAYEKILIDHEIFIKLKDAEFEAKNSAVRYTKDQVMHELHKKAEALSD